ncbi:hypothetical protein U8V72_11045 [Priestia filamentosa]|uniref:hypothetical protein n=1 Tax=Priestia filamentosa TaxID=1402861 RepID=UPI003979BD8A
MNLVNNLLFLGIPGISFNPLVILLLSGFAIMLLGVYLLPILLPNYINSLKIGKRSRTFLHPILYKLPNRWFGLLLFIFLSLFKKKYRVYVTTALKRNYNPILFEHDFLVYVANEPISSYSKYILDTVHYFQSIRTKKFKRNIIKRLQFHIQSYRLDNKSSRMKQYEVMRFKLGKWLNLESEEQAVITLKKEAEQQVLLSAQLARKAGITESVRKRF